MKPGLGNKIIAPRRVAAILYLIKIFGVAAALRDAFFRTPRPRLHDPSGASQPGLNC